MVVQTKFNMSGKMLKVRKQFSQSVRPIASVAVSKIDKTDLVFVKPGAKISRVYYCENVYSNKVYCRQFAVSRTTTTTCSSRTEHHARHSPHCRLPAFQCAWVHWTRKLAAKQSIYKSSGLFSVDSVVADGVTSQNFRYCSAEASSDRRSQDTLNRVIDQLPIRLRMVIKTKVVMLNFVWTNDMC